MSRGQQITTALELLRSAREDVGSSRIEQLDLESNALPYEVMTEDQYQDHLRQDRQEAGEFLVEDDGIGYLEDSSNRPRSQRKRSSLQPSTPPRRKRQTLSHVMQKNAEMRTPEDDTKSNASDALLAEILGDMELKSQPPTPRPEDHLTDDLSALLALADADPDSQSGSNPGPKMDSADLELSPSGLLPFFILDAEDNPRSPGMVYLFGKVLIRKRPVSCCVCVRCLERTLFVVPKNDLFRQVDELEQRFEGIELLRYLHEIATPLKDEVCDLLRSRGVKGKIIMKPVKRNYAFDDSRIPQGSQFMLKVKFQDQGVDTLPNTLKGQHFIVIYGSKQSLLESILLKRKIKGPSWIGVRKPTKIEDSKRSSWCSLEVEVYSHKDLVTSSSEDWIRQPAAALKVLSVSIERQKSEKTHLLEITMVNLLELEDVKIDEPMIKEEWNQSQRLGFKTGISKHTQHLWPTNTISAIKLLDQKRTHKVHFSEDERSLLSWVIQEMHKFDPDVIVGHQLLSQNLNILLDRMRKTKVDQRSQMSRLKRPKFSNKSSEAFPGRLLCDVQDSAEDLVKENDYSLQTLSKDLLDLHQTEVSFQEAQSNLQLMQKWVLQGESKTWCILGILFHLSTLPLTKQLTNLSGNLWNGTFQRRRAERNDTLLLHEFHNRKFLLPEKPGTSKADHSKRAKGPQYTGGLVLEPKTGLYDKLVLLLDFNSLYPSIIQEYNICFTTVDRSDPASSQLPDSAPLASAPLPTVIKELVERRKQVKNLLSKTKDPVQRQQLMTRQSALKLTANSMYGCLGAAHSRFYCKPLAQLITQQGREILQNSANVVEGELRLEVIYGDTDSLMINSGKADFNEVMQLGLMVKKAINKKYRLLEMDVEAIFKSLLLLKKKKYAAMKLTIQNGALEEALEEKGVDTVRRDWSSIAREAGSVVLKEILSGKAKEEVVVNIHEYLRTLSERMRSGVLSMSQFVIIKKLSKNPEDYPDGKSQPHVQVALRRKQAGKQDAISAQEMVPYIICLPQDSSTGQDQNFAGRAFHPDEVQSRPFELKIDLDYYLAHQIHRLVARLCCPIEGTDKARLAECLGLDSTKYDCRTSAGEILESQESALVSSNGLWNDSPVEALVLQLNGLEFEFGGVEAVLENRTQAKDLLGPPELWKDPNSRLSSTQLANQVVLQSRRLISEYYDSWCKSEDDERQITRIPVFAEVTGGTKKWKRVISEHSVYSQLMYWIRQLDIDGVVSKISNQEAKVDALEKLRDLKDEFAPALSLLLKIKESSRFGCVNLGALLGNKSKSGARTGS